MNVINIMTSNKNRQDYEMRKLKITAYIFLSLIAIVILFIVIICSFLQSQITTKNKKYNVDWKDATQMYINSVKAGNIVPIVVSLTTIPMRMKDDGELQPFLKSLLTQDIVPIAIELNVPYIMKRKNIPYVIPDYLIDCEVISVNRCDDKGPATKYIPTLMKYQDQPYTKILVMDDDLILDENFIGDVYKESLKYPDCVIAGGRNYTR